MNELITTRQNESGDIIVSARELHEFLKVDTPFRKWFPRMTDYGFVEGADYTPDIFVRPLNNQGTKDYLLKIDMAKEISMLQRSDKGKQAFVPGSKLSAAAKRDPVTFKGKNNSRTL
jgi:anti-repressor protein